MRLAWICVLLCIVQCIQTCRIAKKKSSKVVSTSWKLPPDNEDWYGFENLLLTTDDHTTTTLAPQGTTVSDVEADKDFPWIGLSPGDTVFDPPREATIKNYIGQSMGCFLPLDKGAGSFPAIRWYYNFTADRCVPFIYTGSKGNSNRWLTKYNCHVSCRMPAKPCCVPEKLMNYEKFLKEPELELATYAGWG